MVASVAYCLDGTSRDDEAKQGREIVLAAPTADLDMMLMVCELKSIDQGFRRPIETESIILFQVCIFHSLTTMVAITVSTPGKPTINIDFAGKHPSNVTVRDLKSAIQVKIPKVRISLF